jgi:hypothetical protein
MTLRRVVNGEDTTPGSKENQSSTAIKYTMYISRGADTQRRVDDAVETLYHVHIERWSYVLYAAVIIYISKRGAQGR